MKSFKYIFFNDLNNAIKGVEMQNILIINQPMGNRGDEAAHRGLMRTLEKNVPQANFTVLSLLENECNIETFIVESNRISYINISGLSKGITFMQRWSLRIDMLCLSMLHPTIRKYSRYIKNADYVICAPGGICMGSFQNWGHIFNLSLAKYYNKRVAYYSRSFGPFPSTTKWNKIFKSVSYNLLNHFDFLSIRDKKTIEFADKLKLKYFASVDTAFLDTPIAEIPDEIKNLLINDKFVVFVPNSLTWHPAYINRQQKDIDLFYIEIFRVLLSKYSKIIMLPQLYNSKLIDFDYFERLKSLINSDKIIVLRDTYSSDIQQIIISKAEIIIGARYHSIVFAINNNTPFISLSYEHKMTGLLNLLDLNNREIDMSNIGTKDFNMTISLTNLQQLLDDKYVNAERVQMKAKKIAQDTFELLINQFKET